MTGEIEHSGSDKLFALLQGALPQHLLSRGMHALARSRQPAVRNLVNAGKVRVVGAIYDLGTGKVNWLPEAKIRETLERVETSPDKETEPFAK